MQDADYSLHYRKWHSYEPAHVAATGAYYRAVAGPYLPSNRDAALLDLGCGMGLSLLAYQALGYHNSSGIDISAGQVALAQGQGLRAELVEDSAAYLRARPSSHDFISAFDVLEHLPREELLPLLRAAFESLKPGGVLLCVVPNANSPLATRWRYIDWTHHTSFTEHSLEFVLCSAGFAPPRIGEVDYFQRRPARAYLPRKAVARWLLLRALRGWQRLHYCAEFGFATGKVIPLSLNIMAVARREAAPA